jgi:hypothetical protein
MAVAAFSLAFAAGFQNCGRDGFSSADSASVESLETIQDPGDHDPDPELVEKSYTHYEPLLADRFYLKSLFIDVFGPTAVSVDSTRTYLNSSDHGSPCSIYEDQNTFNSATGKWAQADPMEACSRTSPALLSAQVNPKATVTRQALLTHACSDLTTNAGALDHALARISPSATVPEPTRDNILRAFHLFYRQRPAPQEGLMDALTVMFPPTGVTKEHWRTVIYTLCASGYWQVL